LTVLSIFAFLVGLNVLEVFTLKQNDSFSPVGFLLAIALKLALFFPVYLLSNRNRFELARVIGIVSLLHLAFFALQYVVVYGSGYYIDPLYAFTGVEQRYGSNITLPLIGAMYRPTGFFSEPSTYAAFMLVLLVSRYS